MINEISSFVHCALCVTAVPPGYSPREWAQLEVGFTPRGLQVWCKRHECNVMHIDFEGCKHPANIGRALMESEAPKFTDVEGRDNGDGSSTKRE